MHLNDLQQWLALLLFFDYFDYFFLIGFIFSIIKLSASQGTSGNLYDLSSFLVFMKTKLRQPDQL